MSSAEKNLTEKESLQLITEMIGKAKSSYHSDGTNAVMWGIVIFSCSIFTFLEIQFHFNIGFDIWWLMWVALVPQFVMMFRNKKNKNMVSYEETTMSYVWWAFAASVLMLMFFSSHYRMEHSESLYLMLFGIPTFITGGMFRFKPMIIGGIICCIVFVISVYTSSKTNMLLMALAALSAWLIPGLILRRKCSRAAQQ
jgi:hypothetical protein